jgi:RND family efflux transporter MFP subunit
MNNALKKGGLPIIVLLFAAAVAWLMVNSRSDLPRRERAALVPVVDVVTAQPGPVPITLRSRGTVTPQYNIELVSEVSGRVVWVAEAFEQGAQVQQGEPLLRIDPIDYEVALSEARAAVASAELSLAEVRVLEMRAAVNDAKATLAAARDRLRQAEVDLRNTEIVAPFDAIIDAKRVDYGQYVQGGSAVMTLLSTEKVQVRLPLLASDLPFIDDAPEGADLAHPVTLGATFGREQYQWQAQLVRIEKRVDEQTRVFHALAEVERPYDQSLHTRALSIGQFVEAEIAGTAVMNAVRLPRSALHGGETVFLVQGDQLVRRAVTVARSDGTTVVVSAGLNAGDRVVVSRLDLMVEGMPVTVKAD